MTPNRSGESSPARVPDSWTGEQPSRPGPNGGSHWRSLVVSTLTLASSVFFSSTCVHIPVHKSAGERLGEYLKTHPELPPGVADAMDRGHVVLGMDQSQVVVVLGPPLTRTEYGGVPPAEVWLYPGDRFHQDQLGAHGATLFRVVFVDGRLALFEPI